MRLAIPFRGVRCEPDANTLETISIGALVQESARGNTVHRREVTIDVVRKSKRLPSACCVRALNRGVTSTNRGTVKTRSSHAPCEYLWRTVNAFDPFMMQLEEERNKERFNIIDEIFRTLSMAGLIYSLYSCHGYYALGACVVTSLSILDLFKLYRIKKKQTEEMEMSRFYDNSSETKATYESRLNIFNWVILGGSFAYTVGNNYAVVANYPLLLANWALSPEGFYQGWTMRRTINDYLMATYVMCMTEALRQAGTS